MLSIWSADSSILSTIYCAHIQKTESGILEIGNLTVCNSFMSLDTSNLLSLKLYKKLKFKYQKKIPFTGDSL